MYREKFHALAAVGQDEVERLSRQLGKPISVDHNARYMLARIALHMPDGEAYMREHVRIIGEDMVQRRPDAAGYKFEYEPPDADERRRAGQIPASITFLE